MARGWLHGIAWATFAFCLVVGLSGCITAGISPSLNDSRSSTSDTTPSMGDLLLTGTLGLSGTAGWSLSDAGLLVTRDGGRTWSRLDLPIGVAPKAVAAVATAPDRPVWLATATPDAVEIYNSGSTAPAAWSSQKLTIAWPDGSIPELPSKVLIDPGPSGLLAVAALDQTGMASALPFLFVSSDNGRTFTQQPAKSRSGANWAWQHLTFTTPRSGVVVAGPTADMILHTADGGVTWTDVNPAGLPAAGNFELGEPGIDGSDIVIPITTLTRAPDGSVNGSTFGLLLSRDGGASLMRTGSDLPLGPAIGAASDSIGRVIWVVPHRGEVVYKSPDGGQTWASVKATGLTGGANGGVALITMTGAASATAVIGQSGCSSFKADCWSRSYLVATSDGGSTWVRL